MKSVRSIVITALTSSSLAALVAAAPSASAQTGSFTLSLTQEFGSHLTTTVTLTCDPVGGTHPDGVAACADLTAANGVISRIPPQTNTVCPLVIAPVNAQATGVWLGSPRSYNMTFQNGCFANRSTGGHVFHF